MQLRTRRPLPPSPQPTPLAALTVGLALALCAGTAPAGIVTTMVHGGGSFTADELNQWLVATETNRSQQAWTDWSQNCDTVVEGPGCSLGSGGGFPTPANRRPTIFSWGEYEHEQNSVLRIRAAEDVIIESISLRSAEAGLGPVNGPKPLDGIAFGDTRTGQGTMVVYEQPVLPAPPGSVNALSEHQIQEQLLAIEFWGPNNVLLNNSIVDRPVLPDTMTGHYTFIDEEGLLGIRQFSFENTYRLDTPVFLPAGGEIDIRFYEQIWNNFGVWDDGFPDAYYGGLQVNLNLQPTELPTLALTSVEFGEVRAGTSASADMIAYNSGGGSLDGQFNTFVAPDVFSADPDGVQPFEGLSGGTTGTTAGRQFQFSPAELAWNSVAPVEVSATQVATVDAATTATNTEASADISGTGVGPVFSLARAGQDPLDVNKVVRYVFTDGVQTERGIFQVDLSDIDIASPAFARALLLGNLFGEAFGDETLLSIYNIGIDQAFGNPDFFQIVSGAPGPGEQIDIQAGEQALDPLGIGFDPTAAGTFRAWLFFDTNMNRVLNPDTDDLYRITFELFYQNQVPVPPTPLLIAGGLFGLFRLRQRWSLVR